MSTEGHLLDNFRWAIGGASQTDIRTVEETLRTTLPADYCAVLRAHDGGRGWVGKGAYLELWSTTDVVASNQTLEVGTFVPETILFGSNGAGEFYGVRVNGDLETFSRFSAVGMSMDEGIELGSSWPAFLNALAENR